MTREQLEQRRQVHADRIDELQKQVEKAQIEITQRHGSIIEINEQIKEMSGNVTPLDQRRA